MRIRHAPVLVLCLIAAASPPPGAAQVVDEQAAVLKVVQDLFDGMRTRDTTLMRSLFVADARLVNVVAREGVPTLNVTTVDAFVRSIAGAPEGTLIDERFYDPEVRIEGPLATVWTWYDLLLGDRWSHCGVDAFMLARLPAGWKITQLADTRQRTGCTTPAAPR